MAQLLIEGGSRLVGQVRISGSKNAVLPILAASLLSEDECRLTNVPEIEDVHTMRQLLQSLGVEVTHPQPGQLRISAARLASAEVPPAMARRMRASFLLMGPLLARTGEARVAKPGGDDIGMRRVEQHIVGLRLMGAEVDVQDGDYVAHARRLHGATIHLDMPTVTGTENLMMAAVTADGVTTIHNAAREPHVVDLARFLAGMGAQVRGAGTDVIQVEGVKELRGARHQVIPDNIEAGTYAIAVAATRGEAMLEDVDVSHLRALILKLRAAGAHVEEQGRGLLVEASQPLQAVDVTTWTHPGFPTDLQAPYLSLMTQAEGHCVVSEALFENRFQHVAELNKLGADIRVEGRSALIHGPTALHAARVRIPDIRAGAALVVAGLCAKGTTALDNVYHLDRGYEDIEAKFQRLGANLTRVEAGGDERDDLSKVVGD
ncbi:MAG TPA: UDP-N-acetylglucosamine 1-carboxyvinyltransferase [Candidatus Eisenbacteria bacterium]|nr:UDP-N-acetylglucosamine 1-carboxyvinyltransferase [Candidatus Eisenbacteria bacterium]